MTNKCGAKPTQPHLTRDVCRYHIDAQEKSKGIEPGLLEAIGHIESKLAPLSVNASGRGYTFKTVAEAVRFIKDKQSQGCRNISVGPMQLHLPSHRRHFNSIEEMLDPQKNIGYAAKLLTRLKRQTGSTEKAVKLYHSANNPIANEAYKNRVFGAWAKIRKRKTASGVKEVPTKFDREGQNPTNLPTKKQIKSQSKSNSVPQQWPLKKSDI
ncbi:transglycosylase SLT domain-containing protein [Candidatus Paracaedibacter symbiosus]|uniref:transglycosylase SLT domain-containing protein n=1 Tax=Candidatus Paracaedibacter symbiosus TaxID=244582 RepID=UPI0018DC432A|nr:transglycosylase SLT domain-containing protein [Candidatus Paracaedibacter symbiosus]